MQEKRERDIIVNAIESFFRSIIPRVNLNPVIKIDDSLQEICEYVSLVAQLVQSRIQNSDLTIPTQVKLCFDL